MTGGGSDGTWGDRRGRGLARVGRALDGEALVDRPGLGPLERGRVREQLVILGQLMSRASTTYQSTEDSVRGLFAR